MRDARCAENVIVLLSTALVKPEGNTTEGDPDGIYPHGRVPSNPSQKLTGDPGLRGVGPGTAPRY